MPQSLEEISKQAIHLPREQRLALASFLLSLDDAVQGADAEAAWEREIRARIEAIDSGSAVGISYEDVMRQAHDRLTP